MEFKQDQYDFEAACGVTETMEDMLIAEQEDQAYADDLWEMIGEYAENAPTTRDEEIASFTNALASFTF